MAILITGATGFIGAEIATQLLNDHDRTEIFYLVRGENSAKRLNLILMKHGIHRAILPYNIINGDLSDSINWITDDRLSDVNVVINCAAVASFGNHSLIRKVNIDDTLSFAQNCKFYLRHLRKFIHISTAMACGKQDDPYIYPNWNEPGEHFLPYTQSKYEGEMLLRLLGLPLQIIRPSIVIGHSDYGCIPSGSIFWVFRIAAALKAFPCSLSDSLDMLPVDIVAEKIIDFATYRFDNFNTQHISSGNQSVPFGQYMTSFGIDESNYQQMPVEEIAKLNFSVLGNVNKKIVLKAIKIYGEFSKLNYKFHTDSHSYMSRKTFDLCKETSFESIAEQMEYDYKR